MGELPMKSLLLSKSIESLLNLHEIPATMGPSPRAALSLQVKAFSDLTAGNSDVLFLSFTGPLGVYILYIIYNIISICIRIRLHIRIYIYTYIRICTWSPVLYVYICFMCIHEWFRTYMHACIHTYMHTCIHAYMHTCIHAYTHTRIHAYMHTCIHAYIHT